jgi:hypothetical protein
MQEQGCVGSVQCRTGEVFGQIVVGVTAIRDVICLPCIGFICRSRVSCAAAFMRKWRV